MNEQIGLEENQEKLLYFIMPVISEKEQERFDIVNVNLCSQYYTFESSNIMIGSMLIISMETYFDGNKDYLLNNNVTDYECVTQLERTKAQGGKALFLKYKQNLFNEKIRFKKGKLVSLDDID